jgi:hypothetical protein
MWAVLVFDYIENLRIFRCLWILISSVVTQILIQWPLLAVIYKKANDLQVIRSSCPAEPCALAECGLKFFCEVSQAGRMLRSLGCWYLSIWKFCYNKTGKLRIMWHESAFLQPLLRWQINIAHSGCVNVALIIQHAKRIGRTVICGLPGSKIFLHILS